MEMLGDQDREYDVILYCKLDGTRISAHRDVLSRSSSFFEAMFSSGMMETNQKEITLKEIPDLTLKEVVKYCYTGDLTIHNVEILIEAADYFQFNNNVLEKSIEFMSKNLCVDNCMDIVLIAESKDTFHDISVETLEKVLKRNTLEVSNEEFVFKSIQQWYKRDMRNRKKYLPDLMKLVHLSRLDRSFIVSYFLEFCTEHDCFEVIEDASKFLSQNDNTLHKRSNRRMSDKIVAFDDKTIQVYSEEIKIWSTFKCIKSDVLPFDDHWMERIEYYSPVYSSGYLSSLRKIKLWNRETISELTLSNLNRITKAYWSQGDNSKLYVVGYNRYEDGSINNLLNCFQYDSDKDSGSWISLHEIVKVKFHFCIEYIDSYLYVLGAVIKSDFGKQNHDASTPLCRYSIVKREWETCPPMEDNRFGISTVATSVNGCIYVVCQSSVKKTKPIIHCFNPKTYSWKLVTMNVPCQNMKACGTNKFLYIVGDRMKISTKTHLDDETVDNETNDFHYSSIFPAFSLKNVKFDQAEGDKVAFRYDSKEDQWTKLHSLGPLNGDFNLLNGSNFL